METTQPLSLGSASLIAGRYRLGLLLGRGATAEVFRARDELLGRDVAVKIFHHDSISEDDEARRQSEVTIHAGMNHRGLVTVYDVGADESRPADRRTFVVMELISGGTLSRTLAGGPLPPISVATLGAALADALAYIHSRGVIHRDIKPANILLPSGDDAMTEPRLADFGIARLSDSTRMTAVGSTIGTANYLSPEQVTGEPLGPATDMYSFGLLLIECLSGTQAYPGHGIEAALARLQHGPAVPEHLGKAWTRLLTALTQRNPNNRPTALEARDRLRTMSIDETGESDATELLGPLAGIAWQTQPAHAAPVGRRWPLLKIAGGLAALAVAAVVLLAMTSGASAPPVGANSATTAATSPAPSTSPGTAAAPESTVPAITVALPTSGTPAGAPPVAIPPSAKNHGKGNGKDSGKDNGDG